MVLVKGTAAMSESGEKPMRDSRTDWRMKAKRMLRRRRISSLIASTAASSGAEGGREGGREGVEGVLRMKE